MLSQPALQLVQLDTFTAPAREYRDPTGHTVQDEGARPYKPAGHPWALAPMGPLDARSTATDNDTSNDACVKVDTFRMSLGFVKY